MNETSPNIELLKRTVLGLVLLVAAIISFAMITSSPEEPDSTAPDDTLGCPYVKIAADDGDQSSSDFYDENC